MEHHTSPPRSLNSLDAMSPCIFGDTYYSGPDRETKERLIADWPRVSSKTVSRTLNGNHEMYSGGVGSFQALNSAPFAQQASCFPMQNAIWLLLCLDTAFVDFDLDEAQVDWVTRRIAAAGSRKILLFSHHQPYSVLSGEGENLEAKLGVILDSGRIYAWFFGHEHRLILYAPHTKWGVSARCVGYPPDRSQGTAQAEASVAVEPTSRLPRPRRETCSLAALLNHGASPERSRASRPVARFSNQE